MQLVLEVPQAHDYVDLRMRSGMGPKDLERAEIALQNSLFTASLYEGEKLIAFGRIVGDGGIAFVVNDVMVDAEYRRQGHAETIMRAIDGYFDLNTHEDSYICLIANSPADTLYHRHRFDYLPADKCGMLRNQAGLS